ncbi:hypothetical protein LTR86_011188 [Recurvomyces mirabilis]|nr:hypothetical protein LTR86_011188 [Recurvomyces mirabilis]
MDSADSASNETLNRRLHLTSKLCSLSYYKKSILCTPMHIVQDSSISYSYDLKVFLCTTYSRVQSPNAILGHLKHQHRVEYGRLKKVVNSIQEEIDSLTANNVKDIAITHNAYYLSVLPVTFNNFKCRDCSHVNVNRKGVRNHFQAQHPQPTKSINQKVDCVLEDVPLQVLEGFSKNKKIYFIPKLPEFPAKTPPVHYEDVCDRPSTLSHVFSDNDRTLITGAHQKNIEDRENEQSYNDAATHNKKLHDIFLTDSNVLGFLQDKDRDVLVDLFSASSANDLKTKYFDAIEHIHLSDETASLIEKLIGPGIQPIQDDVDQQYTPSLRGVVSRIFHSLLEDPIYLKIKQNATLKMPVVHFYFCSILRSQTKEIADVSMVSKIASIVIYNTRLLFLAYSYDFEDEKLLEANAMNRMYEKEMRKYLSNDSKKYYEELTQNRAYSLDQTKR